MTGRLPARVLMTVDAVGGVWRYAMELGRALEDRGVGVVFAGLGPPASADQRREARTIGELEWLDEPLDWMAADESELSTLPATLARLSDRHRIDLLHLNLPSQAKGLRDTAPAIAVTHSCMPTWWRAVRGTALPPEWEWRRKLNREGLREAYLVVAPSRAHADLTIEAYGPIDNLAVVHNGVDGPRQAVRKLPFVLAAGRWWDEGKNAALLDRAAAGLAWPVRMAGGLRGSDGQSVELRVAQALGPLDHAALMRLMQTAAIVVSPSLYEPFGLAALEGARCGAALALADIATYRELWDGAAVFFDPRDPAEAHAVLSRLIADGTLREELGEKALARSASYTAERQGARMLDLYRSTMQSAAPAAMAET